METLEGAGGVVEIFGIASHAPSIKVGLEDLGAQNIIRQGDVVTVFVVKLDLLCRRRRSTCVVTIAGSIGKKLGTDAGAIKWVSVPSLSGRGERERSLRSARVSVPACISKLKTDVDDGVIVCELPAYNDMNSTTTTIILNAPRIQFPPAKQARCELT